VLWHLHTFGDQAMMIAAVDRLPRHSIIFAMNVESYRHVLRCESAPKWDPTRNSANLLK